MENPQIELLLKSSKIDEEAKDSLARAYKEYQSIVSFKNEILALQVKDESDETTMLKAGKAYDNIKTWLKQLEDKRKELKEESLKKGQLIDKIAKLYRDDFEIMLEHAKTQRDYKVLLEAKRREELKAIRYEAIKEFSQYIPGTIDILSLSDDDFEVIKEGARLQHEKAIAIKEEQEKAEQEKAQLLSVYSSRMYELAKYAFFDSENQIPQLTTASTEIEYQFILANLKAKKQEADIKQAELQEQLAKAEQEKAQAAPVSTTRIFSNPSKPWTPLTQNEWQDLDKANEFLNSLDAILNFDIDNIQDLQILNFVESAKSQVEAIHATLKSSLEQYSKIKKAS